MRLPSIYGKFVAKIPKKVDKKSMKKHVIFYFLTKIFDIFNYIRIARQFENVFNYSSLHFGHLEIFQ
jgi:long-subunit acyl-CoA synthetase (AMP-forming)